jgi:GxxExxY protein
LEREAIQRTEIKELEMPQNESLHENLISKEIVDAAYKIHTKLGPGLLESVYEVILTHELKKRGLHVQRQLPVPIIWDDIRFEEGYRLDLMVEDKVLVEIKSIEKVDPVHKKQLLTYLRLMDKRLGLLINFNEEVIRTGITRVVNGLEE